MGDNYDVFWCPGQSLRGEQIRDLFGVDGEFPGTNRWTCYAFNPFFTYASNTTPRTAGVRDVLKPLNCAYAYDLPYDVITDPAVCSHRGGINVLYVGGHVNWLPEDQFIVEGVDFRDQGHRPAN